MRSARITSIESAGLRGPVIDSMFWCAAGVVPALVGSAIISAAAFRWMPLDDPPEVVGIPLLSGYSEAAEHFGFYAFIIAAALLSFALRSLIGRLRYGPVCLAGALMLPIPLCAPMWSKAPLSLPIATAMGVGAFALGSKWRDDSNRFHSVGWLLFAFVVWGMGFPELPLVALSLDLQLAPVLFASVVGWFVARAVGVSIRILTTLAFLVLLVFVGAGMLIANVRELALGVSGAAAFWLGARKRPTTGLVNAFCHPQWLLCVAGLAGVFFVKPGWSLLGVARPGLAVAGGAAAAVLFHRAMELATPRLPALRWRQIRLQRWILVMPVIGIAMTSFSKPWFGVAAAALAASVFFWQLSRDRRGQVIPILALALMFLFMNGPRLPVIDPFHDGQVLSAVWEFETGRQLYSGVFPLRGYDFFVAWIARRILPPSFATYQFGEELFTFLPVTGVCLAVFAWTRSVPWSFAAGMVTGTHHGLSGRLGVSMLLAALGVWVFRYRVRRAVVWPCPTSRGVPTGRATPLPLPSHLDRASGEDGLRPGEGCSGNLKTSRIGTVTLSQVTWLVGAGVIAAICGFDVFVPFICASALSIAFDQSGDGSRFVFFVRGVFRSIIFVVLVAVAFTLLIASWQGWSSAWAYWRLLFDNARNLPSFYGLPLPWNDLVLRVYLVASMVVIGAWGASIVWMWSQMRRGMRVAAIFLLVYASLLCARALGRSDMAHFRAIIPPSVTLLAIGSFEALRFLRRCGIRSFVVDARLVAALVAMLASWRTPHGHMSISRLVYRIHLAPGVLDDRITPPPGVLERVSEHDYLWEVENALLTYAAKRHNPTRHALAYCISSPAEQRVAVASMRQHPPKLISWQSVSGSNAIPNSLRFYVISQYIFQHYRPSSIPYYLEPASHDWKSELELPEAIQCQLPLNHLPLRWGRDRVEALNRRRMEERRIDSWTAVETAVESSAQSGSGWQASHLALPVEFNYLAMELQGGTARPGAPSHCEAALAFAPAGRWYDSRDGATFRLICDDVKRLYIVPVGCSPGWSWRREIEHIKITVPDGYQLERPETTCWRIDETRE